MAQPPENNNQPNDDRYGLRDEDFAPVPPNQPNQPTQTLGNQPLASDWEATSKHNHASPPNEPPHTPPPSAYTTAVSEGRNIYAGFWERLAAYLIDSVIRLVVLVVLLAGLFFLYDAFGSASLSDDSDENMVEVAYHLLSIVFSVFYFAWFHSRSGATPGKKLLKLRVVNRQGEHPSFLHACGRWFASFFSLILYVGFIMAAFTDRRQALHDMMAKTHVIHKDAIFDESLPAANHAKRKNNGCLIAGIVFAVCFIPITAILAAIALPAYHDYLIRSQTQVVLNEMETVKLRTQTFYDQYGAFPKHVEDLGLETSELPVTKINIDQGTGIIHFKPALQSSSKDIDIQFVPQMEEGQMVWYCVLEGLKDNHKPLNCRDSFDE